MPERALFLRLFPTLAVGTLRRSPTHRPRAESSDRHSILLLNRRGALFLVPIAQWIERQLAELKVGRSSRPRGTMVGCRSLVERAALEMRYVRKGIGGSNPSPTATRSSLIFLNHSNLLKFNK